MRRVTVVFAALAAPLCAPVALADDEGLTRELGTVVVTGRRPTSLPAQIPTTIEGITGEEIVATINATDSEDALKYFPSLLVRKRYVGDYDHAVLASRASGTGNSARSLVYADGILLSNLLGNGASFAPRWGLVTPEEIERVDVLYGPFSAAYSGNSVGAVVDYVTRMPEELEVRAKVSTFGGDVEVWGIDDRYTGRQTSASVGDRTGNWSWWLNLNRLDSNGHPLGFANKLVSAGIADTAGTPVTGALAKLNPRNQDWLILGSTTQTDTVQNHAKAKLAYDFSPTLRLSYTLGWWENEAVRSSASYLRDAAGNTVYSDSINVDGRRYTVAPADFAPSRGDLQHVIHGVSIKSSTLGTFDWELAASVYDYARDLTRSPTVALPAAAAGGAGRIADQDGTGWGTFAFRSTWRPQGVDGAHQLDFGFQQEDYELNTLVSDTNDWLMGAPQARFAAFHGEAELHSVYAQDSWRLADTRRATLGLRVERWHASDGSVSNASVTRGLPERVETFASPKAAMAWQLTPQWELKTSLGRAVRFPTVAELYQGSIAANVIVNNDPNLKPEKSWTAELTAERPLSMGSLRSTLFHEDTRDALYSQTNVTVTPNVTNIQNVDHIRTSGVELAYQASGIGLRSLDVMASVTYAHSRIVENANFPASVDKWQPRVPDWRANAVATYHFGERWQATLGARYSGQQFNTLDNSDPNGMSFTGVSEFFVVDARVRYVDERWNASLGIDNLNNEEYWNFHPYTQRTFAAEIGVTF